MPPYTPDPAFAALFTAFTGDDAGIGKRLAGITLAQTSSDPLLVSSSSDIALFRGDGRATETMSFRRHTRGFTELTAISHVPLALCYIARMRELAPASPQWRASLQLLIERSRGARAANTVAMWRDHVAVQAFSGAESKLADMVEYTLSASLDYMNRALAVPEMLDFAMLRRDYLDAASDRLPVPMNDVMFATFALAMLDIGYRISTWLRRLDIDWTRAMVLVSGQSGRPTAGVTWSSNNMCHFIWRASCKRLPPDRLFVAPHAPKFSLESAPTEEALKALEHAYRRIWRGTRDTIDVARRAFDGYEPYRFAPATPDAMPPIRSLDDHAACVARLRRIMEDPQQLLANCVADYICEELYRCDFRPQDVAIPGFTQVTYPRARA
jgi:Domain of unknown function (DUF5624)